jgi:hypothetical protein
MRRSFDMRLKLRVTLAFILIALYAVSTTLAKPEVTEFDGSLEGPGGTIGHRVAIEEGEFVVAELICSDESIDPFLTVYGPDESEVAYDDENSIYCPGSGWYSAGVSFTAQDSGEYMFYAGTWANGGTYTLTVTVTTEPPDDDRDGDGVLDDDDNCPTMYNINQFDSDAGDCDGAAEIESADIVTDNCPDVSNPEQEDTDQDGIGDACDTIDNPDPDGDDVVNATDNCMETANPEQEDADEDGIGDACDAGDDPDLDDIETADDNCPDTANPGQEDTDEDGIGDACDDDSDCPLDDGDDCQNAPNPEATDEALTEAACDPDPDGDGIPSPVDHRCANVFSADQTGTDDDRLTNSGARLATPTPP